MKFVVALALVAVTSSSSAFAEDDPNAAIASGVVKLAASMNEMALACKHMSGPEVASAQEKQRSAAMADMKISAAVYDKLYSDAAADFRKKWATGSPQKQKQTCDQMRQAMPK